MEILIQPWPWYVAGPGIALVMFLLIYSGKNLGMSANLRTMCSIGGGGKYSDFFNFDWRSQKWNLIFLIGSVVGGFLAGSFLTPDETVSLSPDTVRALHEMGFKNPGDGYVPDEIFSYESLFSLKGLLILLGAGFLVGFGARYAGGCTSGHAISGLSDLQWPSLVAVVGFFIGGITMTYFLLPIIFN
ncbi:MAG: YeeE/YedE family protein [Cyclobacteriaceae bacterium]|nr:YeeE/YedE family protein [Cyclobacteriaceae bacterium]